MAAAKRPGTPGFELVARDAPEVRSAWQGRPIAFYAARLTGCGQRLLPLAGPLPIGVGLEARLVVRVEGFNRGHSLTIDHGWREVAETALTFVKRFT